MRVQAPQSDLEYEQQWHGLPVDDLEELDDASINFNLCDDARSDAGSQHYMSVSGVCLQV